ncbi:pheromone-regulated protein prm10 [Coemansia sp. Benny D115]|nr:pheromone-regulated protein prm10 [Coemansia sp. Benny D115]
MQGQQQNSSSDNSQDSSPRFADQSSTPSPSLSTSPYPAQQSTGSSTVSEEGNAVFIRQTQSVPPILPQPAQPAAAAAAAAATITTTAAGATSPFDTEAFPDAATVAETNPATSSRTRPILRLAMLNAQEKAEVEKNGIQYPSTAPTKSVPLELPSTGYFAPRGPLARSNTSHTPTPPGQSTSQKSDGNRRGSNRIADMRKKPALRFASRDSVHTFEDNHSSQHPSTSTNRLYTPIDMPSMDPDFGTRQAEPGGLRRRLTRATTNLAGIGRALNPVESESETESGTTSSTEEHMEKLLNRHANNSQETAPTSNIAANNADITNHPDFYPINPSMQNPGVIHVNMSGHTAAENIVNSVLGTIGTSTRQPAATSSPSESPATAAGEKRPAAIGSGISPANLEAGLGRPLHPLPAAGFSPPPLGTSATSLRGVYANLSKLQARMADYQDKRDKRMRDAQHRVRKRQLKEEEEKKRKKEEEGLTRRALDRLTDMRTKAQQHRYSRSMANMALAQEASEPDEEFVLHSFRTMPRPDSIAHMIDSMDNEHRSKSGAPSRGSTAPSPASTPPRSVTHSPIVSPAQTPGWDEILATSGMLTGGSLGGATTPMYGGPGSRASVASMDATMQGFEAERQKILAQLTEIFHRQNFVLLASRALMGFGAPLHRLEANLIAIALHLDIQATFAVLPGIILITFGDEDTRASDTYVVRMVAGYDMHRLERTNRTVRRVLKGRISVGQGVRNLERILATPPMYPWWVMVANYVVISFFICPLFWNGSWRDAGVSALLGLIVGLLQLMAGRFTNYANLFEVSSAFIVSFIAALLQGHDICFAVVSFAGIAMLLPGLALTTSIIEMVSRNMITGAVRFVFAMARCFILGYGISVGSTLGTRVLGLSTSVDLLADQMSSSTGMGNCTQGLSKYWWFLFLPVLSLAFNISISAHWRQWPTMLFAGCLAYTVSYFSAFSDAVAPLAPAIAAFAMGLYANIMASFSNHRSAVEPILGGVLLMVPGSLGLRTVLAFITSSGNSSGNFLYDMFSTSLSIAAGLFLSGMVVFPNRKKRVGLMTF